MHMRQTNIFLYPTPIIHANYSYSYGLPQIIYKDCTKVYYGFLLCCTPALPGITKASLL